MDSPDSLIAGRYRPTRELGRGGSAVVHAALDTQLDRAVALKRLKPGAADEEAERFAREAKLLAGLRHPSLLEVYDAGSHQGRPFLTARLLTGRTLAERLAESRLPPGLALDWALRLLGALAVAHDGGVLHRDVKPSNIFLERGPDGVERPILIDFGIAKRTESERTTQSGVTWGTPAYMSPEVLRHEPATARSDVWSVGVVLYEMLAGGRPFVAASVPELIASVLRDAPTPLGERAPDVPCALALTVDKALRRSEERFASPRALAHALVEAASTDGVALPKDPDRVAFTEWDAWVAACPGETARVVSPVSDSGADRAGRAEPGAPRSRWRRPVLGAAAVALLLGAAFAIPAGGRPEDTKRPGAKSETLAAAPTAVDAIESPENREASASGSALPPEPEPASESAPPVLPQVRDATKLAPQSPQDAHARPLPEIVRTWDL